MSAEGQLQANAEVFRLYDINTGARAIREAIEGAGPVVTDTLKLDWGSNNPPPEFLRDGSARERVLDSLLIFEALTAADSANRQMLIDAASAIKNAFVDLGAWVAPHVSTFAKAGLVASGGYIGLEAAKLAWGLGLSAQFASFFEAVATLPIF